MPHECIQTLYKVVGQLWTGEQHDLLYISKTVLSGLNMERNAEGRKLETDRRLGFCNISFKKEQGWLVLR